MSAAKRRINRKIALLVRMDAQHRQYWRVMDRAKRARIIANMYPLGKRISRMGYAERGIAAVRAQRIARGWS